MKKAVPAVVVLLLLAASLLQWGLDRTPAGTDAGENEYFPSASSFLDILGGARQYVAYTLYIKSDMLHHAYYGAIGEEAELVPYYLLVALMDPHYISTYYVGAEEIYQQGRHEEAIEFNLQGIGANPESADLYYGLAGLYLEEKRYEDARRAFEEALRYEPEIVSKNLILTGLSAACKAQGDLEAQKRVLLEQATYNRLRLNEEELTHEQRKWAVRAVNDALQTANPEPR